MSNPFEPEPPLEPQKPPSFERKLAVPIPPFSEQEYVDRELQVTRAHMARGLKEIIDPREGETKGEGRLDRTERYARWRYNAYLAGEVASL